MQGSGGSGDMGIGRPIDALAIVALPSCDDHACRYEADVVLPADEIMPAVRWLEDNGEVMWITANMTLVRTFGDGTWLQVLPLLEANDRDGSVGQGAGRLGAIEPVDGTLFPNGLFPAEVATPIPKGGAWMFTAGFDYGRVVERERIAMGDASRPLEMAAGSLHVEIDPPCPHAAHLTLHDDAGDRVFDTDVHKKRSVVATFSIPTQTTWQLTLHDGGGIDFDQGRQGSGVRVGEIRSDGDPIIVNAGFDCTERRGSVEVDTREGR
jgi:hypothetical protein